MGGEAQLLSPAKRRQTVEHVRDTLARDVVTERRVFWMVTIADGFTRECLAIGVSSKETSEDVLERLSDLFARKAVPDDFRSDNGSEFTATRVRELLARVGVKTLSIDCHKAENLR